MHLIIVLLRVFILVGAFENTHGQDTQNAAFENFLYDYMEYFPNYVVRNNLDPSPPNPVEHVLTIDNYPSRFNFSVTLKGEQVIGYGSQPVPISIMRTSVDIVKRTIEFRFETNGPIIFKGNYSSIGAVDNGVPIVGEGKFSWNITNCTQQTLFYHFDITPEGYVSLEDQPNRYSLYAWLADTEYYFDNFLENGDGGQGSLIWSALKVALTNRYANWHTLHPIGSIVHQYFTRVFQIVTYDNIIGSTVTTYKPPVFAEPASEPIPVMPMKLNVTDAIVKSVRGSSRLGLRSKI